MNKTPSKKHERAVATLVRKLSLLIQQTLQDPEFPTFVSISSVELSRDLSHAKVYFTMLTGEVKDAEARLNTAAPFLRTALARTVSWRTVPKLHFVYDASIENARQIRQLIDDAIADDDTTT